MKTAPLHRMLSLGAILVAGILTSPALASPIVTINTRVAEISVAIDDALKAHPGLVADLTTEGRKWVAKEIGRASVGKECTVLCRSRWSPYH